MAEVDPLRALAREFQAKHSAEMFVTCSLTDLEAFAEQVQALQRDADAQIAEQYQIHGHSVAEPQIRAIAAAIRKGASERPRADTSDVASGPQAETSQCSHTFNFGFCRWCNAPEQPEAAHASLLQEMETLRTWDDFGRPASPAVPGSFILRSDALALLRRSAAPGTETPR